MGSRMGGHDRLPPEVVDGILGGEEGPLETAIRHYGPLALEYSEKYLRKIGEGYDMEGIEDVSSEALWEFSEALTRDFGRFYENYMSDR